MKLAINKATCEGQIVSDEKAETLQDTHRVVEATLRNEGPAGVFHYVDVWGGTWRVMDDETECTVGNMEKWG